MPLPPQFLTVPSSLFPPVFSSWHEARRSERASWPDSISTTLRLLLLQRTDEPHQILHLLGRHRLVGGHFALPTRNDSRKIRIALLLNVGRGQVARLHRFLTFAIWSVTHGALGLERRLGCRHIRLGRCADQACACQQRRHQCRCPEVPSRYCLHVLLPE